MAGLMAPRSAAEGDALTHQGLVTWASATRRFEGPGRACLRPARDADDNDAAMAALPFASVIGDPIVGGLAWYSQPSVKIAPRQAALLAGARIGLQPPLHCGSIIHCRVRRERDTHPFPFGPRSFTFAPKSEPVREHLPSSARGATRGWQRRLVLVSDQLIPQPARRPACRR